MAAGAAVPARATAVETALVASGLVAWTSGNISARLPDEDLMAIKASGVPYAELTPEAVDALVAVAGPGSGSPLLSVELRQLGAKNIVIQVDMDDRTAMSLQDDLTTQIVKQRARGVLIDISGLDVVDSFIGRMLANIAAMARVLDAKTVVVDCRARAA